jgi:hypothetical protein
VYRNNSWDSDWVTISDIKFFGICARRYHDLDYPHHNFSRDYLHYNWSSRRWLYCPQQFLPFRLHPYFVCQRRSVHKRIFHMSNPIDFLFCFAGRSQRSDGVRAWWRYNTTGSYWNSLELGKHHLQLTECSRMLQFARNAMQHLRQRLCRHYCDILEWVCPGWERWSSPDCLSWNALCCRSWSRVWRDWWPCVKQPVQARKGFTHSITCESNGHTTIR